MEDAESKNHEKDIRKPWERLMSEKQLVTEFTKGQLVPTSSGPEFTAGSHLRVTELSINKIKKSWMILKIYFGPGVA